MSSFGPAASEAITFLIFVGIFYLALIAFGIAQYIVSALGIMRLSQSRGIPDGWMGFIPYASLYQTGKIAGGIEIGKKRIQNTGLWMVLFPIIYSAVILVFYVGMVISMLPLMNMHEPSFGQIGAFMVVYIACFIFLMVASVAYIIFTIIVYYKIFSCHYSPMRALFYALLSVYVPLAMGILFSKIAKEPIINPPEYMIPPPYMPQPQYAPPQYIQQPPQYPY